MHHQPKQLALLISLIGVGVSPYAQARVGEAPQGALPTLPGLACSEAEAAALPACGPASELVWAPQRSALDLSGTPGVLVLYRASRDDWAPGEEPRTEEGFDEPLPAALQQTAPAAAAEPSREERLTSMGREIDKRIEQGEVGQGKTRRIGALAKVSAGVKVDAAVFERIAPLQVADAPVAVRVVPRFAEHSPEAERLLDNLIAILTKPDPTPTPSLAGPEMAAEAASEPVEKIARMLDANPAQLERAKVEVESPSDQVLRNLGAIISDQRDAVGALPSAAPVASTQSEKVLATLQGIAPSSEPAPAVEDGPAKRLRKLAARAEKAEAKAAAAAVAAGVVDLMLPLELPTHAALPADVLGTAAAMLTEPAPIPIGAPTGPETHASPFGDEQVAVAETSLDRVRGGFSPGDGLNISFGIERAVYVNGALVTSTTLNVTDLGQVSAGRTLATLASGTFALVQNGIGNSVATGSISPSTVGTVIQNTLNGQKIQNMTVINATVNSLSIFQNLNLGASLRSAVIGSLQR